MDVLFNCIMITDVYLVQVQRKVYVIPHVVIVSDVVFKSLCETTRTVMMLSVSMYDSMYCYGMYVVHYSNCYALA